MTFNNNKLGIYALSMFILLTIVSCNKNPENEFVQNQYGYAFKHCVKNDNSPKARLNDILFGEMKIMLNDSLELFNNYGSPERLFKILNPKKGNIDEFLLNLHLGDSAIIIAPADSISKYVAGINSNHKDKIYFYISVSQIISKKEMDANELEQKQQDIIEDSILNQFAISKKWKAEKQKSGLYYISIKKGSGKKPEFGQTVKVNYSVSTLEGKIVDTNIKPIAEKAKIYSSNRKYEPFEFVLGDEGVIAGWNEGISLTNVGGSSRLLIPSKLAYGSEEYGPIKSNSSLIFEITLLEIEE